jgi:CheY-like chemotaxis protein
MDSIITLPIMVYNNKGHSHNLHQAFTQIFGWTLDGLNGRCIPFVPVAEKPIASHKIREKNKGTGLGLSVVQGIIKSIGGGIQVLSESGRGSEFHIYWPLTRTEREIERTKPQKPISGGTEKILLVDDEASIIKVVGQMLERLGYQVTAYTSSIAALAAFKADPESFDLILTDMTMPEMTGDLLAQEAMAVRPSIPVLISTGYSSTLTAEAAKAIGIKGMLVKPASKAILAAAVREILDRST